MTGGLEGSVVVRAKGRAARLARLDRWVVGVPIGPVTTEAVAPGMASPHRRSVSTVRGRQRRRRRRRREVSEAVAAGAVHTEVAGEVGAGIRRAIVDPDFIAAAVVTIDHIGHGACTAYLAR